MITEYKIDHWKNSIFYKQFPHIIDSISLKKISDELYTAPVLDNFEAIMDGLESRTPFNRTHYEELKAFTLINNNLSKCYIETIPVTDGVKTYPKSVFKINITYDDMFSKFQMDRSGCMDILRYLNLRDINRVQKKVGNYLLTREKVQILAEEPVMHSDPEKMKVVEKLITHYGALYRSELADERNLVFFDLLELVRTRPRDKALWLNLTGGFGKDVLITLLANFWNSRIFTEDINDDMNNAPRVRAERELARTNSEIWNRPELKEDANRVDIERRVQSIKTHTGRTKDIIEIDGDVRVNSAFTIETTNADLQLRNDPDIARRFIVFKMEGVSLTETLTPQEVAELVNGKYNQEIEFLYFQYLASEKNKDYLKRLINLSTPINEVIDEETKEVRTLIPSGWKYYTSIPKPWVDKVVEKNSKQFNGMKLKDKMRMLGLGNAESKNVKIIKVDSSNPNNKVEESQTLSVRENKNAKKDATAPVVTIYGKFNEVTGEFKENE